MHELGMCEDIVAAVTQRAQGRRVAAVRVRVGSLQRVHPEAFVQSFALAADGTVAAGARVDLVAVAARTRCASCGATTESEELLTACPACGGVDVRIAGGDELVLESIEYLPAAAPTVGRTP
jgi:hydrogenase nickel incorporation protein HypA/HybF